jgi:hypothetical protein
VEKSFKMAEKKVKEMKDHNYLKFQKVKSA